MKKEDIYCPHCNKKGTWKQDNPFRPFCCERCKIIDLGAWADQRYSIPSEDSPSSEDQSDQ